jgi:hypothetical protein
MSFEDCTFFLKKNLLKQALLQNESDSAGFGLMLS